MQEVVTIEVTTMHELQVIKGKEGFKNFSPHSLENACAFKHSKINSMTSHYLVLLGVESGLTKPKDISLLFGINLKSVYYYLKRLAELGYLYKSGREYCITIKGILFIRMFSTFSKLQKKGVGFGYSESKDGHPESKNGCSESILKGGCSESRGGSKGGCYGSRSRSMCYGSGSVSKDGYYGNGRSGSGKCRKIGEGVKGVEEILRAVSSGKKIRYSGAVREEVYRRFGKYSVSFGSYKVHFCKKRIFRRFNWKRSRELVFVSDRWVLYIKNPYGFKLLMDWFYGKVKDEVVLEFFGRLYEKCYRRINGFMSSVMKRVMNRYGIMDTELMSKIKKEISAFSKGLAEELANECTVQSIVSGRLSSEGKLLKGVITLERAREAWCEPSLRIRWDGYRKYLEDKFGLRLPRRIKRFQIYTKKDRDGYIFKFEHYLPKEYKEDVELLGVQVFSTSELLLLLHFIGVLLGDRKFDYGYALQIFTDGYKNCMLEVEYQPPLA